MDDSDVKPSWADQVELGEDDSVPTPHIDYDDRKRTKTITEIKFNDEGKKVKVVKVFNIETRKVCKSIARRKAWKKFGAAAGDPPGPNAANTYLSEEILFQFVHSKENPQGDAEDDPLKKLKSTKMVSCRICKGDHWTTRCPYKDTLAPLQDVLETDKKKEDIPEDPAPSADGLGRTSGRYVPPNRRDGGNLKGETMVNRSRDDTATIRVTNLSEDTRESDLQELFRPFGSIARIYLAKDKVTGQSKGFAFINFHRKEDAARAIAGVSGFGYDHLILNVEWAKPSGVTP